MWPLMWLLANHQGILRVGIQSSFCILKKIGRGSVTFGKILKLQYFISKKIAAFDATENF